jgi:hypothetical protein
MIAYGPHVLLELETQGTLILGKSRTPTAYELENCTHHVLTSDLAWTPHSVNMAVHSTHTNHTSDDYTSTYLFCEHDQTIGDDYRILGDTSTLLDLRIIASITNSVKSDIPFPHTFISSKNPQRNITYGQQSYHYLDDTVPIVTFTAIIYVEHLRQIYIMVDVPAHEVISIVLLWLTQTVSVLHTHKRVRHLMKQLNHYNR